MALDGVLDRGFRVSESAVTTPSRLRSSKLSAKDRLVVALDKPTVREAEVLVEELAGAVGVYKIGLQLVMSVGGLKFARDLRKHQNQQVFLDMKLLDIGNTIEKSVANVADSGFQFLTVHGKNRKALRAAVTGRRSIQADHVRDRLKLLAVTVLTDQSETDLREEGLNKSAIELAVERAKMAEEEGFDGVIASGEEARAIREATGPNFIIKVPGVRLPGSDPKDQTRAVTPEAAMKAGATYIVVGRPIYESHDPAVVANRFIEEIAKYAR